MKIDDIARTAKVRFDGNLKTFPALLSYYLNISKRVRGLNRKLVAKGPLSPVEIIYATEALAYDVSTHTTLQIVFEGNTNIIQHAINAGISSEINPWNLITLGAGLSQDDGVPLDLFSTAFNGFNEQLIKGFQLLANIKSKPLLFWEVPIYDIEAKNWAIEYLKNEIQQYFDWMEYQTGIRMTQERLERAVQLGNQIRNDMIELNKYLTSPQVPITALELYIIQVMMGDYAQDPEGLHKLLKQLLREIEFKVKQSEQINSTADSPVRVYIIGDETTELYLYNLIEDYGGVVVGLNFRLPLYYELIDEQTLSIESLAHWIWNMPTNLPIQKRIEFELNHIRKQKTDAVIISSVVGSRCLPGAEKLFRDSIKQELGIPVIEIETSMPGDNVERIDYQVRGLLQTLSY